MCLYPLPRWVGNVRALRGGWVIVLVPLQYFSMNTVYLGPRPIVQSATLLPDLRRIASA